MFNTKGAKNYLEVVHGIVKSERTLQQWRRAGGGPLFRRYGNDVMYAADDLDRWVEQHFSNPVSSTAQEAAERLIERQRAKTRETKTAAA